MALISASIVNADIYDNRFIPLFSSPQFFIDGQESFFEVDFLAATASKAFATDDKTIGIPEIFGIFDLNTLSNAMVQIGEKSPLRSDLRGQKYPFVVDGRLQSQGFFMRYYQTFRKYYTFGANIIFLNTQEVRNLKPGEMYELELARREAFEEIGLTDNYAWQHGLSDLDLYFRFGNKWNYALKCRKVYAGVSLGLLAPTGVKTDLSSAASIPYGGNGHTGLYIRGDSVFEVQEDKKVGFVLQATARLPKTVTTRMPIVPSEPYIFGALIGQVRINPAATIAFSPYFVLEHLRSGLGVGIFYTLVSHRKDKWTDARSNKAVPVDLNGAMKTSKWGADYFTIDVLYDFGKIKRKHAIDPILSFRWDVPSMLFVSHDIPQTHKISLGVTLAY